MKMLAIVLAAVLLVSAEAKVVPASNVEGQQTSSQPVQLADLIVQAQTNINNLARSIQEQLNLPDQETVVNTVKEQSTTFVNNLQEYVKNVTEEVKTKSPELERLWTDVKGKLSKVVEDINTQIPNAQEHAQQLQAKFQEGVQTIVRESDRAIKAYEENTGKIQEDIAKFTKQAVDLAVQATQNLNNQLQQAAASSPSS